MSGRSPHFAAGDLEVRQGAIEVDIESDIITMTYIWNDPELEATT